MRRLFVIIFMLFLVLNIYAKLLIFNDTNGIDSKYLNIYKDIKLEKEKYFIYMPETKSNSEKLSLWSFIYSGDNFEMPPDWKEFCDKNKIIILAPYNVGNKQTTYRRIGVTLLGTSKIIYDKKIDPKKVFIFGFSGGARVAMMATFYHSEVFNGCLGICGAQFIKKVKFSSCNDPGEYGYFEYKGSDVEEIKKKNIFAIITGSEDFRYCYLKDIYKFGFKKEGFIVKLFDYKNYQHTLCNADQLEDVLAFWLTFN